MQLNTREDIHRRLNRVEGQVRGVQKMISENKPASAILQQLAAIISAVHGVGLRLAGDSIMEGMAANASLDKDALRLREMEIMDMLERIP